MPLFTLPATVASDLLAQASAIITGSGVIQVVILAAGLPLAFWGIKRLIGLIPKGK